MSDKSVGPQRKGTGRTSGSLLKESGHTYDEEFAIFAVSLQKSRTLRLLDFEGSRLAQEHVHMIAKMLSENRSLERVCHCRENERNNVGERRSRGHARENEMILSLSSNAHQLTCT